MPKISGHTAWSSLLEGDEDLYLPNCQSNFVIPYHAVSLLFGIFINTTAYHCADKSLHVLLAVALPTQTVNAHKRHRNNMEQIMMLAIFKRPLLIIL